MIVARLFAMTKEWANPKQSTSHANNDENRSQNENEEQGENISSKVPSTEIPHTGEG